MLKRAMTSDTQRAHSSVPLELGFSRPGLGLRIYISYQSVGNADAAGLGAACPAPLPWVLSVLFEFWAPCLWAGTHEAMCTPGSVPEHIQPKTECFQP